MCEEFDPPPLTIESMAAHWIDQDTIVWDRDLSSVRLYGSSSAALTADENGNVIGGAELAMLTATTLSEAQTTALPHFSAYVAYSTRLTADAVKAAGSQPTHQLPYPS